MKSGLLLFIALILHFTVFCQNRLSKGKIFTFGIGAGLAKSNLYGSKNYTSYPSGTIYSLDKKHGNNLLSYSAGVWANYSLSPVLGIVGEVNFTEKGQRNAIEGVHNSEPYDITLNVTLRYLSVPLLLQYNYNKFPRLGIYAGFEPSLLLSAKQEISGNFDSGTTDIKNDFEGYDLGIVAGINYRFFKGIMLDFRLVNGVKDVSAEDENTFVSNKSFHVGIKFLLFK